MAFPKHLIKIFRRKFTVIWIVIVFFITKRKAHRNDCNIKPVNQRRRQISGGFGYNTKLIHQRHPLPNIIHIYYGTFIAANVQSIIFIITSEFI
ncbi:hypothetical protein SDC9_133721 [bioreactor metagenome]|uniref:Uncharacterized protein n=1 Tax=bioreactor metagenome TaxID=1076179 RepID=A0A645DBE8_9ZZZZ